MVALDLVLYLQHVVFHAVPVFWRFHMMHHADLDVDVTTGARFHPVEVIISLFIKLGAVVLLGASPAAVLAFEVLLNATSMFNHSNVRMPETVDRYLRWIIVTPDMHTGFITLLLRVRPTRTSASTCPGGIASSARIALNLRTDTRA